MRLEGCLGIPGQGLAWRYLWVKLQRPLLMGVFLLFLISGERCPHPRPPVPQELWVQMYLRLQVGTWWLGSGTQA